MNFTPRLLPIITILTILISLSYGYLLVLNAKDSPGLVIFDAGIVTRPGQPPRRYVMNFHRSASFVKHLLHLDHYTGSVVLKRWLECDGVRYPHIFTVYIDSLSNSTLNYISFPLRVLIQSCEDAEFEGKSLSCVYLFLNGICLFIQLYIDMK